MEPMSKCTHMCNRISWRAITAAALIGLGISFLLNLFSIAIGLSAFGMRDGSVVLVGGGFAGILIGTIASTYTSGFAAGYLGWSCCARRNWGIMYGFLAWCLALLLMVVFAAYIGRFVASYTAFVMGPATVVNAAEPASPAVNAATTAGLNHMGLVTFMIFILFFIGAISSCFGGYYGAACRERCEATPGPTM